MFLISLLLLAIANFSLTDASLNNEQKAFDGDTRYVVLENNKSFYDQVDNRRKGAINTIYEIKYEFDLHGRTINIPDNCVLKFNGGILKNGSINGYDIGIEALEKQIFDNVTLGSSTIIKNTDVYLSWFCNPSKGDCTGIINNVIDKCKSIILSSNTTYIVNSTITLKDEQSILFSFGAVLRKTKGTGPIIYINGSNNSVLAPPKGGLLKSDVETPDGLIAIGEFGTKVLNGMCIHNKIDGLRFEGVISNKNKLSIGLLCKNTGINVGAYYNSISNLDMRYFNVGVAIRGGFNGNIINDISFYACGGDYPPIGHIKSDNEAAIVMESWDVKGGDFAWGEVLENTISNISVGYSPNGCPLLMIGSIKANIISGMISEPEGMRAYSFRWKSKFHYGTEYVPKYNIVSCSGQTMQGPASGGEFANNNIILSGDAMTIGAPIISGNIGRIKEKIYVASRIIDETRDTWSGRDSRTAEYPVMDGKQYGIGTLSLRNSGDDAIFMRIYISSISASYYAFSSVFNIQVFRDSNNIIKHNVWGEYDTDGYRLLDIESDNSNRIIIGVRAPAVGTSGLSLMRVTTEVYSRDSDVFSLNAEPVLLKKGKKVLNFDISGWDSQRPSNPKVGTCFFSKDLEKPIWYKGNNVWVDANGKPVD